MMDSRKLAEAIAAGIFKRGEECADGKPVARIQFRHGKRFGKTENETAGGGLCLEALEHVIESVITQWQTGEVK